MDKYPGMNLNTAIEKAKAICIVWNENKHVSIVSEAVTNFEDYLDAFENPEKCDNCEHLGRFRQENGTSQVCWLTKRFYPLDDMRPDGCVFRQRTTDTTKPVNNLKGEQKC